MQHPLAGKSRDEIRDYLVDELTDYLSHAVRNADFYDGKFGPGDVEKIDSLDSFRRHVPVVRKPELVADQAEDPPYGSRLTVPPTEIVKVHRTSGSSGKGREVWALTKADQQAHVDQLSVGFDWIGLDSDDVIVNTIPVGMTAGGDWFSKAFEGLDANVFDVGPYATEEKVRVIDRFDATAVFALPPYLTRLASTADELGIDVAVDTIMTAGANLSETWVEEIEADWNGTVYEEYGATEGSSVWTCEHGAFHDGGRGTIHLYQGYCYHEVVEPDDPTRHVSHGEAGELVITPFCRTGMPLVRFATGDRVTYIGPGECRCGREFGGIESGTVGRFDDMLKIKGVNVWPHAVDDVVFDYAAVREYRGAVSVDDGREVAAVEVEFEDGIPAEKRAAVRGQIEADLKERTGVRMAVREATSELSSIDAADDKPDRWTDDR